MLRQYTPSYEKAQKAYIHVFSYANPDSFPDEKLVFPFSIFCDEDTFQGGNRATGKLFAEIAIANGF